MEVLATLISTLTILEIDSTLFHVTETFPLLQAKLSGTHMRHSVSVWDLEGTSLNVTLTTLAN